MSPNSSQQSEHIPTPSVRRLSLYLRQLEFLQSNQVRTVSSRKLADSLGLTDAQVRKDLGYFGQFGRPGVGYEVEPMIQQLRSILGTDKISRTILVGVGNIGRAIAAYNGFREKGFELIALVDADRRKIGKKIGQLTVQSIDEIERVIHENHIRLAIVAVPAKAAREVIERLAACGVRGILNFAPAQVPAPPGVTIRNLDVAAELEQISFLARHPDD